MTTTPKVKLKATQTQPEIALTAIGQVTWYMGEALRGRRDNAFVVSKVYPWQQEQDMPIMAYCPIAQGGSLRRELLTDAAVKDVASELNVTPAQVLLAWAIRQVDGGRDIIATPKAANPEQVEQNAAALSLQLNNETLERLDKAFPAPRRKTSLDIM